LGRIKSYLSFKPFFFVEYKSKQIKVRSNKADANLHHA